MFSEDMIGLKHLRMDSSLDELGMAGSKRKMRIMEERSDDPREIVTNTTQTIQTIDIYHL